MFGTYTSQKRHTKHYTREIYIRTMTSTSYEGIERYILEYIDILFTTTFVYGVSEPPLIFCLIYIDKAFS